MAIPQGKMRRMETGKEPEDVIPPPVPASRTIVATRKRNSQYKVAGWIFVGGAVLIVLMNFAMASQSPSGPLSRKERPSAAKAVAHNEPLITHEVDAMQLGDTSPESSLGSGDHYGEDHPNTLPIPCRLFLGSDEPFLQREAEGTTSRPTSAASGILHGRRSRP